MEQFTAGLRRMLAAPTQSIDIAQAASRNVDEQLRVLRAN